MSVVLLPYPHSPAACPPPPSSRLPPQTAEYLLEHGLLDLVVPRSFLKGALYEIIDFYRAAPYKKRGYIPHGVQHGTFLTTEEKVGRGQKHGQRLYTLRSMSHLGRGYAARRLPRWPDTVGGQGSGFPGAGGTQACKEGTCGRAGP